LLPSLPPAAPDELIVIDDGLDHGSAEMRLGMVLATGTAAGLSGRQAAQECFVNLLSAAGHVVWPAPERAATTFLASRTPTQPMVKQHHVRAFLGFHKTWPDGFNNHLDGLSFSSLRVILTSATVTYTPVVHASGTPTKRFTHVIIRTYSPARHSKSSYCSSDHREFGRRRCLSLQLPQTIDLPHSL